jgi:hypothetical protein
MRHAVAVIVRHVRIVFVPVIVVAMPVRVRVDDPVEVLVPVAMIGRAIG